MPLQSNIPAPQAPSFKEDPLEGVSNVESQPWNDAESKDDLDDRANGRAVQSRLKRINQTKTLNYRQLDILRTEIMEKFISELSERGIDVSTPELLEEFLAQVAEVDPDYAQMIAWVLGELSPDQHELDHMRGEGISDIVMRQGEEAAAGALPPMPGMEGDGMMPPDMAGLMGGELPPMPGMEGEMPPPPEGMMSPPEGGSMVPMPPDAPASPPEAPPMPMM